jgi:hypothetical protein
VAAGAAPERYTDHFEFADTIDCSQFNPAWTFSDNFVDFFDVRGQVWVSDAGEPLRAIEHIVHRSNDVNSVTGFTLHEHNHFTAQIDFIAGTVTLNGAINIMQRPGAGSVIREGGPPTRDECSVSRIAALMPRYARVAQAGESTSASACAAVSASSAALHGTR